MPELTLRDRIIFWILEKLGLTKEWTKQEMCERAKLTCSGNCETCAWNWGD